MSLATTRCICYGDGHDYHKHCFDAVGFKCGYCEERFLDRDLRWLAVVEPVDGAHRGVYRIVKFPFYADGMIEAHLYRDALRRNGRLLGDEPDEFPVCLLCPDCALKHGSRTQDDKNQRGESDA